MSDSQMGHLLLVPQGEPGFQIRRSCQRMLIKQALCALQPPAKPQTLLSAAQSISTSHQRAYHIPARRLQGWTGIPTPLQQKCKLLPHWAFCKQMQITHGIKYLHTFEKDMNLLCLCEGSLLSNNRPEYWQKQTQKAHLCAFLKADSLTDMSSSGLSKGTPSGYLRCTSATACSKTLCLEGQPRLQANALHST